jgi:hypothetical protein
MSEYKKYSKICMKLLDIEVILTKNPYRIREAKIFIWTRMFYLNDIYYWKTIVHLYTFFDAKLKLMEKL